MKPTPSAPIQSQHVTVEVKLPRAVAEWFALAAKQADMTPEQVYRVALIVFSALYGQRAADAAQTEKDKSQ